MADEDNEDTLEMETVDVPAMVNEAVTKAFAPMQAWLDQQPIKSATIQIPNINSKTKLGDDENKSFAHYIRTGDDGGIKSLKASNNNPMSRRYTGTRWLRRSYRHVQPDHRQAQRRCALSRVWRVRMIPGKGLTVNVPIEGAKDGAFIATTEAQHD